MSGNFIIGGVIFTLLVPQVLLTVALSALLSFVFTRLGLFRWVAHRPLAEVCMFCIILAVLVILSPDGWPIWPFPASAEPGL